MKIGILGADGFLGKALCKQFPDAVPVTRNSYMFYKGNSFDIFINANGNSKKYWAEGDPFDDFEASVVSVYETFYDFKIKQYVYISSVDAIDPNASYYGFHKTLAEQIVKKNSNDCMILRCCALIGQGMKKGVVQDIIDEKPLWVTGESLFQFTSIADVAESVDKIFLNDIHNETINVGGWGTIRVNEIAKYFDVGFTERKDATTYICNYGNTERLNQIVPVVKTSWQHIKEFANERMDKSV